MIILGQEFIQWRNLDVDRIKRMKYAIMLTSLKTKQLIAPQTVTVGRIRDGRGLSSLVCSLQ